MRKITSTVLVTFREMVLVVELAVFEESVYFGSNIDMQFNSDFCNVLKTTMLIKNPKSKK